MNDRTASSALRMNIAAVERDTGIPKDTLRVWERRYGFPQPLRDAMDERQYPLDQVEKLRLIKRLMGAGHRPGRIVGLPTEHLDALARAQEGPAQAPIARTQAQSLHDLQLIKQHDAEKLRRELVQAQMRLGLGRFVTEIAAPLVTEVGEAWMRGDLEIFEEHLFSEIMHRVLRAGIAAVPGTESPAAARPRVLLTTMPQEPHGMGLLMAEAMLALEGCHCVSLGVQTPLWNMLLAVQAHRSDVLVLSFSGVPTQTQVLDALAELRDKLPAHVALWAGGSSPALKRAAPDIQVTRTLGSLAEAVAAWRSAHPSPPAVDGAA
ncbi:Regulatory protein MerR [Thiomonas sp. X19]|uniref:MerR family transcriptional regulator n=1 Tax=Thiomonas sp. X19 TaxID=1050370 RepID=UPI000B63A04F|nr:MerR family transcriptional regulator [Thiomonas sp. X19]SCC91480.1 Regulatory protein MerR [Thiomonas sp. X19]